jgi:hypothetical protein
LYPAGFRNREEELKNALATSRSKIRDLEIRVWESDWRPGTQTDDERSY